MKHLNINNTAENASYEIRYEMFQGRKHMILPVVMMVEGVHAGSRGPIFHSADELGRDPLAWEGMPVTIDHPQVDGEYVSAHLPDQIKHAVGRVYNARMDGQKLKAEVWIDEQKLIGASPQAMLHIQESRPLDVSVGIFSEELVMEGEWNGETYEAVSSNHRPDHLALLPGGVGACSWEDGCGIRVNQNIDAMEKQLKQLKELNVQGYSFHLITNDTGYMELLNKVSRKLDGLDNDLRMYFLEELYEDSVVYRVSNKQTGESTLYKQNYSILEDESVEFAGDPVEVRRQVEYVSMVQTMKRTKAPAGQNKSISNNKENKGGLKMSEQAKSPCTVAKVDALVAHELTNFVAEDKEWLLTMTDEQLSKLEPKQPKVEPPQVNREQALEALDLKELKDFVELMPKEMQALVNSAVALREDFRKQTIAAIIANSEEGLWHADELQAMSCDMLTKINKAAQKAKAEPPTDYSGAGAGDGGNVQANADEQEPLLPPMPKQEKK